MSQRQWTFSGPSPSSDFEPAIRSLRSQYLTFELDVGGWNNVRLAVELMVVLAQATGRTLVLPPPDAIYLLKEHVALTDLLEFDRRLSVIEMDTFLAREAHRHLACAPPPLPVREAARVGGRPALWAYLRAHGVNTEWRTSSHCLVFGASSGPEEESFCNGRMRVRYNQKLARSWLLHLPTVCCCPVGYPEHGRCDWGTHWMRFAVPFYTFVFFSNPAEDKRFKRLVRDAIRPAAPIRIGANALSRVLTEEGGGSYSALHLRRGDFDQRIRGADVTARVARALLDDGKLGVRPGELLYVASDEADPASLAPLGKVFRVQGLSDHARLLSHIPGLVPDMHGMVEQLAASRARAFIGSLGSTFSGAIVRARGHLHADAPEGGTGRASCWLRQHGRLLLLEALEHGWPHPPFWEREWPVAWERLGADDNRPHWPATLDSQQAALHNQSYAARACLARGLGFSARIGRCLPAGSAHTWHHYSTALASGALFQSSRGDPTPSRLALLSPSFDRVNCSLGGRAANEASCRCSHEALTGGLAGCIQRKEREQRRRGREEDAPEYPELEGNVTAMLRAQVQCRRHHRGKALAWPRKTEAAWRVSSSPRTSDRATRQERPV